MGSLFSSFCVTYVLYLNKAASPAKICGHKAGDIKKESGLPSRKNRLKKTCFDQKQQNMG